jgi:AraC family transcriptional regulator
MAACRQPWSRAAQWEKVGSPFFSLRFRGGVHFSATTQQHLIWFASPVPIDCRIAGRTLRHEAPAGSLAICPAGTDCGADAEESVDALLVAVDPGQLAPLPQRVQRLKRG